MSPEKFEKGISTIEELFNHKYTPAQKQFYFSVLNGAPDEVWVKALKSVGRSFKQYGHQRLPLPAHFEEAIKQNTTPPVREYEVPLSVRQAN